MFPTLLASVAFLAAENGKRLDGVTWNRQALLDGEKAEISAETLVWRLSAHDAMLARTLLSPGDEPFALLLSALRHDREGLGATREARRRRHSIGALQSRRRLTAAARLTESDLSRETRQRWERCCPPSARYALQRLMPDVHALSASLGEEARSMAAMAVFATIGANGNDDDLVHRTGWSGTRMESRYVQCWIIRHRACHIRDLTAVLADAVGLARAEGRGLVLPDLAPRPTAYPWADAGAC